ncbi:MAG: hypothetical protein AAGF74_01080 [Pseudomonadota bacterium]
MPTTRNLFDQSATGLCLAWFVVPVSIVLLSLTLLPLLGAASDRTGHADFTPMTFPAASMVLPDGKPATVVAGWSEGALIYLENCAVCHGDLLQDGSAGRLGATPNPIPIPASTRGAEVVGATAALPFHAPAFLTDGDLAALNVFLADRTADGTLPHPKRLPKGP